MRQDKRCLDYQKVIKEREAELFSLERGQSKALLRDRMRFLRLLKTGVCTSLAAAGRQIGLKLRACEKLWRKYREQGVAGLLHYPYQGYKGKLSEDQEQQLEEELSNDHMQSLQQGCHYVQKTFGVSYTPSGIWNVFQRLKVKKKTARPAHVRKDYAGEKRFKKKSFPA